MKRCTSIFLLTVIALSFASCASHRTAYRWNGLVGIDDKPIFFTSTNRPAIKLFVAIPFIGNSNMAGLIEDVTAHIAEQGGNHVRVVQGGSTNYWFAFPPLTWIFTPVIARVDAEWRPSAETFSKHEAMWAGTVDKDGEPIAHDVAAADDDDDD